jgi:single-strand DNA-binding protein
MNLNKVIIMGNITRDVELRYLPNGNAVTNFSIAVNDKYKKGDKLIENVSYFDVVVFAKQAENCNQYLSKGSPVLVDGKLQQRRWEANDGTKKSKVEVVAQNVIFLNADKGSKPKAEPSNRQDDFNRVSEDDIPF